MSNDHWEIDDSKRLEKLIKALPKEIKPVVFALLKELEKEGPYQNEWHNYSPLKKGKGIPANAFHCHLKKGKPTYVACWCILDKKKKIIEVFYVGTYENAPY